MFNQVQYYNKNTKTLLLPYFFNQMIDSSMFGDDLVRLVFNTGFNQPLRANIILQKQISPFPNSLQYLTFGDQYDQLIGQNVLPPNLTHLTFGYYYNHPIRPDVLPPNLTHLTFGYCYNHPIGPNVLPPNLTYLELGHKFNHLIKLSDLPPCLSELVFTNIDLNILTNIINNLQDQLANVYDNSYKFIIRR